MLCRMIRHWLLRHYLVRRRLLWPICLRLRRCYLLLRVLLPYRRQIVDDDGKAVRRRMTFRRT